MTATETIAALRALVVEAGLPSWDDTPDVVRLIALRRMPGAYNTFDDVTYHCWRDSVDGQDYAIRLDASTVPGEVDASIAEGVQIAGYLPDALVLGVMHAGTENAMRALVQGADTAPIPYWPVRHRSDITADTPIRYSGGPSPIRGLDWHTARGFVVGNWTEGCIAQVGWAERILPVLDVIEARGGPRRYSRWLVEVPDGHPLLQTG